MRVLSLLTVVAALALATALALGPLVEGSSFADFLPIPAAPDSATLRRQS